MLTQQDIAFQNFTHLQARGKLLTSSLALSFCSFSMVSVYFFVKLSTTAWCWAASVSKTSSLLLSSASKRLCCSSASKNYRKESKALKKKKLHFTIESSPLSYSNFIRQTRLTAISSSQTNRNFILFTEKRLRNKPLE